MNEIKCEWCKEPFIAKRKGRKFCCKSCAANSRMSNNEYKKKLYTKERNKKIAENLKTRVLLNKICKCCKAPFLTYSKDQECCNKSCAAKLRMSDNKNRIKISISLTGRKGKILSEDIKKRISKKLKGQKFSKERLQNISSATLIRMSDPIIRKRISDGLYKSLKNGKWKPCSNYYHGYYNDEYYESSYELARFMQLDDLGQNYTKKHFIRIQYVLNGQDRFYYPDILNGSILEEIKPSSQLTREKNKLKFLAAEEYCRTNNLTFKLITEKDLGNYLEKAKKYHLQNNIQATE